MLHSQARGQLKVSDASGLQPIPLLQLRYFAHSSFPKFADLKARNNFENVFQELCAFLQLEECKLNSLSPSSFMKQSAKWMRPHSVSKQLHVTSVPSPRSQTSLFWWNLSAYVSRTAMIGSSLSSLSSLLDVLRKLPLRSAGPGGGKMKAFMFHSVPVVMIMSWRMTVMMLMNPLMRVCPGCSTRCLPSQRSCWDQPPLPGWEWSWLLWAWRWRWSWTDIWKFTWSLVKLPYLAQNIDLNWLEETLPISLGSLLWSSFQNLKLKLVSDGGHLSSWSPKAGFWKNRVLSILGAGAGLA